MSIYPGITKIKSLAKSSVYSHMWKLEMSCKANKIKNGTPENTQSFLIKLSTVLPYDSAIAILDIYTQQIKTFVHRKSTEMFIATLFKIATKWKQMDVYHP